MLYLLTLLFITNYILWKNLKFFSSKFNLYDLPNDSLKLHKNKISLISGFFLLLNLITIFIFSIFFEKRLDLSILSNYKIIIVCITIFIIGYLDDRFSLKPVIRLLFFSITFVLLLNFDSYYILQNIKIDEFEFSLNKNHGIIFTTICFIIYLNAYNFFDGINLQSGLHTIFIYTILFFKLDFNFEIIFLILFYIFFLIMNGKNLVFLGNSGAYLSATLISIFLIFNFKQKILSPTEIFILMSLPGLDMIRIILVRLIKNKHPFKGDLNHIHHLLIKNFEIVQTNIIILVSQIINYTFYLLSDNEIMSILFSVINYLFIIFLVRKKNEK